MYRRLLTAAAAATLTLSLAAGAVGAQEGPPPLHGHMLILGLELDSSGEPTGYRKCVDLAGNQKLPLHVHHGTVHMGNAGEALRAAGHAVVPTAPLSPFADCAALAELFGPPTA